MYGENAWVFWNLKGRTRDFVVIAPWSQLSLLVRYGQAVLAERVASLTEPCSGYHASLSLCIDILRPILHKAMAEEGKYLESHENSMKCVSHITRGPSEQ